MKGVQGLVIAIALGITGAIFNWMYVNSGPSREATVRFLGIKQGQVVNRGEILRGEHLVTVEIPEVYVGNLKEFAVHESAKGTVVGVAVTRNLEGPCLVLEEDVRAAPAELKLEAGEIAMWIPVDSRAFVPSLFKPGDNVSFVVPRTGAPPAGGAPQSPMETIGPFVILALGNRLGSLDVMRAARQSPVQENVLAIRVSSHVPGEQERAERLYALLQSSNFRQVNIQLHSKEKEKQ